MSACHHLESLPGATQDGGADLGLRPQVRDPGDLHARAVKGEGRAIGVIGAGGDHGARSRLHGEAVDIGPRGPMPVSAQRNALTVKAGINALLGDGTKSTGVNGQVSVAWRF